MSVGLILEPDKVLALRAYVQVAPDVLPTGQAHFAVVVTSGDGAIESRAETTFEVPEEK